MHWPLLTFPGVIASTFLTGGVYFISGVSKFPILESGGKVVPIKELGIDSEGSSWEEQLKSSVSKVLSIMCYNYVSQTFQSLYTFTLWNMTQNPKELFFMWIISISIYHIRSEKWETLKHKSTRRMFHQPAEPWDHHMSYSLWKIPLHTCKRMRAKR